MQHRIKNSLKTAIHNHPNYRIVHVSHRSGDVGMLLPHANLVVPDKQTVRKLGDIISLYEKLPLPRFNYGSTSSYERSPQVQPQPAQEIELNSIKGLPLFGKLF